MKKLPKIPISLIEKCVKLNSELRNSGLNINEYDAVIEDCEVMLSRCDEALFIAAAGGLSNGQRIELVTAQKLRKEITITETRTLLDLVRCAVVDKEVTL